MTRQMLLIEEEPGYGPVLKVLADVSDFSGDHENPNFPPDDAFDKWRFNSKRADLTPIRSVFECPYGWANYLNNTFALPGSGIRTLGTSGGATVYLPMTGVTAWNHTPVFDFFLRHDNGWNYPNHWSGDSPSHGADNNWGTNFNPTISFSTQPTDPANPLAHGAWPPYRTIGVSAEFTPWASTHYMNFVLFDIHGMTTTSPDQGVNAPNVYAEANLPWATGGVPVEGQVFSQLDNNGFRVARPGYDANSATENQMIIGGTPRPLLYFTKRVTLAPGEQGVYPLPPETPSDAICLMQWHNSGGSQRFLPSIWVGNRTTTSVFEAAWKIENGNLHVANIRQATTEYLLIVMGRSAHPSASNDPVVTSIDSNGKKYIRFNKDGYVTLDTRYGYLPIIKTGTIPLSGTVTSPAASVASVSFPQQSYIPFVLAYLDSQMIYSITFTDTGNTVTFNQRRIRPFRLYQNSFDQYDSGSFTAHVGTSSIDFRWNYSTFYKDVNAGVQHIPYRINYIIFGVPNFD